MTETAKKKRGMPSSFTILLALLAIVAVITVIVSGTSGGAVTAARLSDFCTAPIKGFADALPVCLFVMILGGFLGMMTETGALDNGIAVLVQKLKGNEIMLIPVLMLIFSLGGTTYGMCEETVPFYALLAATMMAAGFDPMVGAATVLLGAGCGCLGSTVNPFAVGAAVDALTGVGIEVNQSIIIGLGAVLWIVTTAMSIFFVMNYAKKVKADKGSTILSMQELKDAEEAHGKAASEVHKEVKLTGRQKGVLIAFAFTFVVMIVGFIPLADLNEGVANFFDAGAVYDADGNAVVQGWSALITGLPIGQWYFDEASTWFFLMAVLIGIIGGLSEKQIVNTFITGAADMMSVVLVIALARGISVLMANTGLDVFVLDAAANALAGLSGVIFAPMSFLVYFGLSFLIPSTSGMATVSMPIMGPLAVKLGFSPEVMVMIFSAAIGVVNLFTPTSGAIMGGLALAKIEWTTWLKFALKLIVALSVACAIILTVACVLI
ncbi:YfcC family protein [Collinsella aerofaciens]|uniref:YfcC family protein n=2 Tax=Collinsella aerofaciens TaxID=74426 RepID=A0AAW6AHW9_9ACTN|nr:YfcC family protein [Collinsella aerofaciens]CDA36378.1 c4-dicarboxylate anaerobic carrier [Collinsella sp. CAG:166]MDB1835249.1 YfcC family protein [Collinsella aerofaciens]MDB1836877.1 YfcC family protein [Collinsella aerofaciens]MDB1838144.1 YfcC family protein [Collinsella aerofaciens]MDB1840707.1 YfcC family protein [Collinsella aerofaciens]